MKNLFTLKKELSANDQNQILNTINENIEWAQKYENLTGNWLKEQVK